VGAGRNPMKLYRITKQKYLNDLSGLGGSYREGGRWNRPGEPVLYFGLSASVVMLEMGNYIENPRHVPKSMMLGIYEVETSAISTMTLSELPVEWDQFPYPSCTQSLGSTFLTQNRRLILQVPSCATGGLDDITVVNPLHPDARNIQLVEIITQIYNPSLFRGLTPSVR